MKQKLYCYVDETGQDTKGDLFIVSVVITEEEREKLGLALEKIEKATGKGNVKWTRANHKARVAYIKSVLSKPMFKGKLTYAIHRDTKDYLARTILTTARAITINARGDYKATIFVDGLQKSQTGWFGKELRHLRVRTQKVRGVRKEETEPLMRLADTLCGFTRAAVLRKGDLAKLLARAKRDGYITEI